MKIFSLIIIIVILLTSCAKKPNFGKAREHTQNVVKSIYKDTVFSMLKSKYFSSDDARNLLMQFRKQYKPGTLKGRLISEQYNKNFLGNDDVVFIHQYKSEVDNKVVKIRMRYELLKDTFEIKSMIFFNIQ